MMISSRRNLFTTDKPAVIVSDSIFITLLPASQVGIPLRDQLISLELGEGRRAHTQENEVISHSGGGKINLGGEKEIEYSEEDLYALYYDEP